MTEQFNYKLGKAIKKLKTIDEIKLTSIRSSNYTFGIEKLYIEDRYNLEIKLDSDLTLQSQIMFDARYLSFPPDIIIHKLPAEFNTDIRVLLPNDDWNLDQEDCLYNWFKRILNLIKKPEPKKQWSLFDKDDNISQQESSSKNILLSKRISEEPIYKTNMDDDFENDPELFLTKEKRNYKIDDVPAYNRDRYRLKRKDMDLIQEDEFFADQDELLSYKTKEETRKKTQSSFFSRNRYTSTTNRVDTYKDSSRNNTDINDNVDDDILLVPTKKLRKPDFGKRAILYEPKIFNLSNSTDRKFEFRKKFMKEWLIKYKRNIMKYDTDLYSDFTLFMDFRLSSKSHFNAEFKEHKENSIRNFMLEHPDSEQVTKPKSIAPIIIHFKMHRFSFPSSQLEIKLISATNTSSPRSSVPDTMDLKYSVNENDSLSQIMDDIMFIIHDAVPAFHYQLNI